MLEPLVGGRLEGERVGELPVPLVVGGEGEARGGLALGGQPQQLGRHLADLFPGPALRGAPGAAADRVQPRRPEPAA